MRQLVATVLIITAAAVIFPNILNAEAYEVTMKITEISRSNGDTIIIDRPATFVLKNDDLKNKTVVTDFAGNVTLAPGKELRKDIKDEGKITFTIDNGKVRHEVIFTKPEVETDPQVLQRTSKITDLEQEKNQLSKRLQHLQGNITAIENSIGEAARKANISTDEAMTEEQKNELDALSAEYQQLEKRAFDIPKEVEKASNEVRDIKRGIEIVEPPVIDLEQIRNSTDTLGWVKTLFTWHDQKLISTNELVTVIKYLIEQNILS